MKARFQGTLAAFLTVVVAGCAPLTWDRPGTTEAEFNRDFDQCDYEARLATAGYGTSETRRGASSAAGQGVGDAVGQALDRHDLTRACLRARGYTARPG
jgi:hypothetical protein